MVQDGLIFSSERVVIPEEATGSNKTECTCHRQARECIFWSDMSAEMKELRESRQAWRQLCATKGDTESMKAAKQPRGRIATQLFLFKDEEFPVSVPMTKPEN